MRLLRHIFLILDTIYSGSISLIFRFILSVYLVNLVFLLCLAFVTWFILSGLKNFFKPLKHHAN